MLARGASSAAKKRKTTQPNTKPQKRQRVAPARKPMLWLLKSELEDLPFEDVKKAPNKTATFNGVRGYQARGNLRDKMKAGDKAFFYHSGVKHPLIKGIVTIEKDPFVDPDQFEEKNKYYDAKATRDNPKWWSVDVTFESDLVVTYQTLKLNKEQLPNLAIFKQPRLSVSEVTEEDWDTIVSLGSTST